MKNFIVEIAGTAKHITSKNSKSEFSTFEKALAYFNQKVDDLNIEEKDVEINLEKETADTSMLGNDYIVTIYTEEV